MLRIIERTALAGTLHIGVNVAHTRQKMAQRLLTRLIRSMSVLVFLAAPPVTAGQYEDGKAAFNREEFATALRILRPLADRGNPQAQALLGSMYALGEGVPKNYAAALTWYREAAARGDADAQFGLGGMYYLGNGVASDYVQAHKWFSLAASQAHGEGRFLRYFARTYRDRVAEQMTPKQIAEAKKLARGWKPDEN
ncbi:MAG: tetratricopeptide repeat protein [Thiobacillaceae bacterium]